MIQTYERWVQNYYTMRQGVLGALPYPVQVIVGLLAYRKMARNLDGSRKSSPFCRGYCRVQDRSLGEHQ